MTMGAVVSFLLWFTGAIAGSAIAVVLGKSR
jgi:hypothetical protein